MRHLNAGRKLNRTRAHRQALLANMARSLLTFEQIKTTLPKARELRPYAEKIITLGKRDGFTTAVGRMRSARPRARPEIVRPPSPSVTASGRAATRAF